MEGFIPMDAVDRQLIQALRENGRASYAELGRLVGLSGPSVTDRINRLETAGVITGYRATVDAKSLGLGVTALIGISVSDAADHEDVAHRLKDLAEIEDAWFIAGDDSYMLKVRVDDVDGHDAEAVTQALRPGGPGLHVVVARTRKGSGVSYMEGRMEWHYLPLKEPQYLQALREIDLECETSSVNLSSSGP